MWPRRSRVRNPSVTLLRSGEASEPFAPYGLGCSTRASSSTAEQRTLNPQVPGSNPGGRTLYRRTMRCAVSSCAASSFAVVLEEWAGAVT